MTFGVSVAAYNKKPNTYIQKAITPPAPATPTPTAMSTTTQVPNTAPSGIKSALSGSTAPTASGLVNNVQAPIVQPLFSAQAGNKSDSIYGRLGAINSMTDSQNELSQAKVGAANNRINSWNNRVNQQNASSGEFGGMGDSGLDGEQLGYARQIANIGKSRGMSDKGIQIAIMTALAESEMRNIGHGDRDSVGLFQQRTSQGWGSVQQIMDPNYSINKFYDSLAKTNYNGMNPWAAAQAVQRSFDPTGSNYQARYSTAMKAYNAIFQPQSAQGFAGGNSSASWLQQNTNKYIDMDGWYGAQCVDLFSKYTQQFVGGKHIPVGWAPEIINKYDSNVYNRLDRGQTGRMGDVAVFNRGGSTPLGHVSIVIGDNGNGTLRVLSSNYGTGPSGSMNSTVHNISKASLSGYLRPKMLG